MSALFQSYLDTNPTQDISLVGYFPQNDYEDTNLDNYYRASLMDKGPEEVMMPSDDLGRDARAYMSREAVRRQYEPREEIRRGEIDLNDYDHDFRPGEDRNVIMMGAIKDYAKRIRETEYFKRDSAKQIPIGRVAPTMENEMTYSSIVGATRLRQDFYNEREDIIPGKNILHGISKKRLGYNPRACLAADKAMKGYASELNDTTRTQFRGKVKVLDKLFGGFNGAVFEDSIERMHRATGRKGAKTASATQASGEALFNEAGEADIRKTFSHLRQKATNHRIAKISENNFDDATAIITATRASVRSGTKMARDRSFSAVTDFEDASVEGVKKIRMGKDRLDKFTGIIAESGHDFEDELEDAVSKVRGESRKLSSFYHTAHRSEIDFEDDGAQVGIPKKTLKNVRARRGREHLEDDEMGSEDESHVAKTAHKFNARHTRRVLEDGGFDDATEDGAPRSMPTPRRRVDSNVKYAVENADSVTSRTVTRGKMSGTTRRLDQNEDALSRG